MAWNSRPPAADCLNFERKAKLEKLAENLNIPNRVIGLKDCFVPKDEIDIKLDVVAVHGIGVDPANTWTHRRTQANWLKDPTMLPKALPHARIMAFGYNSVWYGKDAVKTTIREVATKLLLALRSNRQDCPRRPIILMGHCFGGLVIQQAYSLAVLHARAWPGIATSITGIMFLGTPHEGIPGRAGLSTQSEMYTAILQTGLQIQDSALRSMAQDNEELLKAVHEFNRGIQISNPQPKIFCFYEQKATNVGRIIGMDTGVEFVVSESSGTFSNHMKEGLPLDHFGMNKFEDAEDNNFERVSEELQRMAEGLGETELSKPTPRLLEFGNGGYTPRSYSAYYSRA